MTPDDIAGLGTVLGLWAHPDDEAFLSAGLGEDVLRRWWSTGSFTMAPPSPGASLVPTARTTVGAGAT